jgi:hypothetical protein
LVTRKVPSKGFRYTLPPLPSFPWRTQVSILHDPFHF